MPTHRSMYQIHLIALAMVQLALVRGVFAEPPNDSPSTDAKSVMTKAMADFDFEEAAKTIPKPRELWPVLRECMLPPDFTVTSDQVVASDTDPSKKLRRVEAKFASIDVLGKKWTHHCVIFVPDDYEARLKQEPARKGKVVIMGSDNVAFPVHVTKVGEPIATRTGYPVMILANPGYYDTGESIEHNIRRLGKLSKKTGKVYYNMNCQLAIVYVQAMNVFQDFLKLDDLKAILGGHSKRGRSTPVAAAFDGRVAAAIIMGNEGAFNPEYGTKHLSFFYSFFQDQIDIPVFYLGTTNEDGYKMFNVNIMQERLKHPMTIELIPNYCHAVMNEIQFMDFMMWVAHVFDDRPITKISEVTHARDDENRRSVFRAKIESKAKIQTVKVWYVYADNPAWRDLMWYHLPMSPQKDGYYSVSFGGKTPDAFLVEVGDISQGILGYVSSLPQKLTDAPVEPRISRGSRPRLWEP